MTYFSWSDEYSVHLRVIDNDHKDLVTTVNTLHEAISGGAQRGQIIGNLAKYVDEHFACEEALMEAYEYPGLAQHKRIHRHLTRIVYAIRIIFGSKPKMIDPGKLLAFLRDWLVHHILEEDTKYAPDLRGGAKSAKRETPRQTAEDSLVPPARELGADVQDDRDETVTVTVPESKAAALRRCARLLAEGGKEGIAI